MKTPTRPRGAETGTELLIRELHPDEWSAYKALRLEALQHDPQAFGTSYADAVQLEDAHWRERLAQVGAAQGSWMLFAVERGLVVGMVAAYAKEPGTVGIVAVYVTASQRGRGISRMLMETLLRQITSSSSTKTASLAVNKCQSIAVALYSSLGFQVTGEVVVTLGDGNLHTEYIMEKALA